MTLKPIPVELLCDDIVLSVPTSTGARTTNIYNVRVIRTNSVSDYITTRKRDNTALTVYYDCQNSVPQDITFLAGEQVKYCGETYEILEVAFFGGAQTHHIRLKCGKDGGSYAAV